MGESNAKIIVGIIYPVGTRSTWKALLDCKSSSQTELANVFPRDWNKVITEGSHTLTSNVRERTYNRMEKKIYQLRGKELKQAHVVINIVSNKIFRLQNCQYERKHVISHEKLTFLHFTREEFPINNQFEHA